MCPKTNDECVWMRRDRDLIYAYSKYMRVEYFTRPDFITKCACVCECVCQFCLSFCFTVFASILIIVTNHFFSRPNLGFFFFVLLINLFSRHPKKNIANVAFYSQKITQPNHPSRMAVSNFHQNNWIFLLCKSAFRRVLFSKSNIKKHNETENIYISMTKPKSFGNSFFLLMNRKSD